MSQLQTVAIPKLVPLLGGTATTLWPDDLRIVARWATMTALTHDASFPHAMVPRVRGAHAFYQAREQPLPRMNIWLGQFDEGEAFLPLLQHRVEVGRETTASVSPEPHAVFTTFVFKHLVIKTIINHDGRVVYDVPGRVNGVNLQRAWPIGGSIDWPPPVPFTPTNILRSATGE